MTTDEAVRDLLRQRGADTIDHPGGTLYAHLVRVHGRLASLGADRSLCLAGLAHAAYGTDGFAVALFRTAERDLLRRLLGDETERLVYRYGACDRGRTWRALAGTRQVWDRFTGRVETLTEAEASRFVDLSIVNELDVAEQNPDLAQRHGGYFREVFASWAPLASARVIAEARRVLGF